MSRPTLEQVDRARGKVADAARYVRRSLDLDALAEQLPAGMARVDVRILLEALDQLDALERVHRAPIGTPV